MSDDWVDRLAAHVEMVQDLATRFDALEALVIDFTREVAGLSARLEAQWTAEDRERLRRAAVEQEIQRRKDAEAERIRREVGL